MPLKLIVANKAYSSWSLRPWILLAHFKIPFEEVVIPMDRPETRAAMLKYAPTGKCPSLHDGKIAVWESLAIIEYVAETYPGEGDLAEGQGGASARALARERDARRVHRAEAGLSDQFPPQGAKAIPLSDEVRADVARIEAAWAHARETFGKAGPFLFGRFSRRRRDVRAGRQPLPRLRHSGREADARLYGGR